MSQAMRFISTEEDIDFDGSVEREPIQNKLLPPSLFKYFMLTKASTHAVGDVWESTNTPGRWYTRRASDGRVVPTKKPSGGGTSPKQPKNNKKPTRAAKVKVTVEQVKAGINEFLKANKVTPESAKIIGDAISSLTVVQINELKKQLGVQAKGKKVELVKQIADQILAKIKPADQGGDKPSETDSGKVAPKETAPESLEAYLKQDKPDDPIAKFIRNDKESITKVKEISSLIDGVMEGKYKQYRDIKATANKLYQDLGDIGKSYGEDSTEYKQARSRWYVVEKQAAAIAGGSGNVDKFEEEAKQEIRTNLIVLLKSAKPPKLDKSYYDGLPKHEWDDASNSMKPSGWIIPPFKPTPEEKEIITFGAAFVSSITEWAGVEKTIQYQQRSPRAYFTVTNAKTEEGPHPIRFRRLLGHKVQIKSGTPSINIGVPHSRESGIATQVHELGHMIEELKPNVKEKVEAFLDYRLGDEKVVDMDSVPGGESMKGEMVRKNHFDRHFRGVSAYYVGKDYRNKKGERYGTEVLSMGIQALYEDPSGFCQNDPEYATFVISMLRSS